MAANKVVSSFMLLARCMPSEVQNAVKVRVKRLEFDQNLHMYFPSFETLYAHDPDKSCKPGDVVLVHQLPQKMTKQITHTVKKVVFPLGDVCDPITGRKVVGQHYREDLVERKRLYGQKRGEKGGFDYDSAPDRGWQKDNKDFTYKDTYKKYHVFENDDQPYAV